MWGWKCPLPAAQDPLNPNLPGAQGSFLPPGMAPPGPQPGHAGAVSEDASIGALPRNPAAKPSGACLAELGPAGAPGGCGSFAAPSSSGGAVAQLAAFPSPSLGRLGRRVPLARALSLGGCRVFPAPALLGLFLGWVSGWACARGALQCQCLLPLPSHCSFQPIGGERGLVARALAWDSGVLGAIPGRAAGRSWASHFTLCASVSPSVTWGP